VSATTLDVDMFLDNVRVDVQAAQTQPLGLLNGGFEADFTNWTASGKPGRLRQRNERAPGERRSKAVVFNAGRTRRTACSRRPSR
jgi:hypothetical protein